MPGDHIDFDLSRWMSDTERTTLGIRHKRSAALSTIDTFIQTLQMPNGDQPQNLESLKLALDTWIQSKGKRKDGRVDTIRDHLDAVTELLRALERATALSGSKPTAFAGIEVGDDSYRGNKWVPDDFEATVRDALRSIDSQPIGAELLASIGTICGRTAGKVVVIEYSGGGSSAAPLPGVNFTSAERKMVQKVSPGSDSFNVQELMSNDRLLATKSGNDWVPGPGTSVVVTWRHDDAERNKERPAFIALAHELVHAYHFCGGLCRRSPTGMVTSGGNTGIMEEELRTVGFGGYAAEVPSENAIRGEHNVALRASYSDTMSFDNVVVTT